MSPSSNGPAAVAAADLAAAMLPLCCARRRCSTLEYGPVEKGVRCVMADAVLARRKRLGAASADARLAAVLSAWWRASGRGLWGAANALMLGDGLVRGRGRELLSTPGVHCVRHAGRGSASLGVAAAACEQ